MAYLIICYKMFSQTLAVGVTYTLHISIFVFLDGSGLSTGRTGMVTLAVFVSTFFLTWWKCHNCTIFKFPIFAPFANLTQD